MQIHVPCVSFVEFLQNGTIEERVSLLETQVVEIEEDVAGLGGDVDLLFDQQIIQDERLFSLEQDVDDFDDELESRCLKYLKVYTSTTVSFFRYFKH